MSNGVWKTGKELGMNHLKFSDHKGTKELDELIRNAEDVIYWWQMKYITPQGKTDILNAFRTYGQAAANIQQSKRKDEFLNQLREAYRIVDAYKPDDYRDCSDYSQKMLNYAVSVFLKNKDTLTDADILKLMQDNKKLFNCIVKPTMGKGIYQPLKLGSFLKMQNQLLTMFQSRYEITI